MSKSTIHDYILTEPLQVKQKRQWRGKGIESGLLEIERRTRIVITF